MLQADEIKSKTRSTQEESLGLLCSQIVGLLLLVMDLKQGQRAGAEDTGLDLGKRENVLNFEERLAAVERENMQLQYISKGHLLEQSLQSRGRGVWSGTWRYTGFDLGAWGPGRTKPISHSR